MAPTTPTGGGAAPANGRAATAKEALFFLEILGNMKNIPDVDWDAVAAKSGYSNANCAKVRFGQIKRALGWGDSTPKARKKVAAATASPGSAIKNSKVKKRVPKKAVKQQADSDDEDLQSDSDKVNNQEMDFEDGGYEDGNGNLARDVQAYGAGFYEHEQGEGETFNAKSGAFHMGDPNNGNDDEV